jgi:hypothetical protein
MSWQRVRYGMVMEIEMEMEWTCTVRMTMMGERTLGRYGEVLISTVCTNIFSRN